MKIEFTQTTMRAELLEGWKSWHVHYYYDPHYERMTIVMHEDGGITRDVLDELVTDPKYLQWTRYLTPAIAIPKGHPRWKDIRVAEQRRMTSLCRGLVTRKRNYPSYDTKALRYARVFLGEPECQ